MTVKIWDNKECSDTYGNAAPGGIMDHMLCAGKQGKDSCSVSFHSFLSVRIASNQQAVLGGLKYLRITYYT